MKSFKKNQFFFILSGILVLTLLIIGIYRTYSPNPLSEDEIGILRETYPIVTGYPPYLEFKEPGIKDIYTLSDAVLLIKVIEELPDYSVNLIEDTDSAEGKMSEKQNGRGIVTATVYKQFKVSVIEVLAKNTASDALLAPKDELIISFSTEFIDYMPDLKDHMKMIIPVLKGTDAHEGKYSMSKYGSYYTTEDNFILSAFEEEKSLAFTGITVEAFKKKLNKELLPLTSKN